MQTKLSMNINGKLIDFSSPLVMAIINFTPDSFFEGSRHRIEIPASADILDLGGYSTRPGADNVSEQEEIERLEKGFEIMKSKYPDAIYSVDTFRASVARIAVKKFGAHIINDVYGGNDEMYKVVAELGVPYILTYPEGGESDKMLLYLSEKIAKLTELGVNDIILDPGFGFGKTLEQNYEIAANLKCLECFNLPILVGISRKSMIQRVIDAPASECLNGSTVLHSILLERGANILRVHDVNEAAEAIKIHNKLKQYTHV